MDDNLEIHGRWWLPERPDRKVPGTLTFSQEDGGRLMLLGGFRSSLEEGERQETDGVVSVSMTEESLERSGTYPRILGSAGNTYFTLEDCFRTHRTNAFSGPEHQAEAIHVNRTFKGAQFESDEPLEASGVAFSTQHLAEWIMKTGIVEQWSVHEDRDPERPAAKFRLEACELPEWHTVTSTGTEVRLKHSVGITGDLLTQRSLTQEFWWRLDLPAMVAVDDLTDLASDLQDLVSIAIDGSAAFGFMSFFRPDIVRDLPGDRRVLHPIELHVRWNVQPIKANRVLHEHDLLFTFDHFEGMAGVQRWLETAAVHREGLGRVMASRYSPAMFVSDRLLNCAAALESLDRVVTGFGNSKFKTRLGRCASLAGQPFKDMVGDIANWAEIVRLERDDVAHNLGLRVKSESMTTYYLWHSLYWLFVLCMLRLSGAPEAVFVHLQAHRQYRMVSRHIQRAS